MDKTTNQIHPDNSIQHPLNPLTPEELNLVVDITKQECHLDERVLFETVCLLEPEKYIVQNYQSGDKIHRKAFVAVLDRNSKKTYEGIISLNENRLISWNHIINVQPRFMNEELEEVVDLLKSHPDYINALKKRDIIDLNKVFIDLFAQGNFGTEEENTKRLMRPHSYYVESRGDNSRVRPIEGLSAVIDLNAMKILRIEDLGIRPIPSDKGNYAAKLQEKLRDQLSELNINQPNGPGFKIKGQLVNWENWSFRVGFTPREGMILHKINYRDGNTDRPIIYRASLAELVVPYAETDNDHFRNHSFDLGENVFGRCVNSLTHGCDCLGEISYMDVCMVNGRGKTVTYKNAICIHEEDYGILWKHTDQFTNKSEVRRSRRIVVSSFYTVGNYDYGIYWYFYLDGTIEFETKLTGILYCGAIEDNKTSSYGRIVAPNVNAMIHEHYFNLRLDMSVDGEKNSVVEVEADLIKTGPDNPYGNAHKTKETLIETENQGARDIKPELGRYWKVINPSKRNRVGDNTGYKLVPGSNIKPMHQPNSPFMKRGGFVEHDLWITQYDKNQISPSGSYINQSAGGDGLSSWYKSNRSIKNEDVVLWYTVGLMHVPRLEDFPIMPVEYIGFKLQPNGFFDKNPSLDVPPAHHKLK